MTAGDAGRACLDRGYCRWPRNPGARVGFGGSGAPPARPILRSAELLAPERVDLLVGVVLIERVDRPDRRRQPADDRDLQHEADDPGDRPPDREEQQPRKDQGDDQAQNMSPFADAIS